MLSFRLPPFVEFVDNLGKHGPAGSPNPFRREFGLASFNVIDVLVVLVRVPELRIATMGVVIPEDASGDRCALACVIAVLDRSPA